jgi:hypothetical protein
MATVPSASHAAFSSVARRSYLSTEAYNSDFFSYAVSFSNNVYTGALSAVTGATATNCPQGRILHETGKKLYPSANPGIGQYMVSVFDPVSMLTGFINPNNPTFSLMNTDRPAYIADSPSGTGTGVSASARANALYTRGDVLAGGRFDLSGSGLIYGNLSTIGNQTVGGNLSTIGTLSVGGNAIFYGNLAQIRGVVSLGDSNTVAASALVSNRIVTATPTAARNIQLPLAADITALTGAIAGTTVEFTFINLASTSGRDATFTNNTTVGSVTTAGNATTSISSSSRWLIVVANASTVVFYRS